jgi:hypothetical protein
MGSVFSRDDRQHFDNLASEDIHFYVAQSHAKFPDVHMDSLRFSLHPVDVTQAGLQHEIEDRGGVRLAYKIYYTDVIGKRIPIITEDDVEYMMRNRRNKAGDSTDTPVSLIVVHCDSDTKK